MNKVVATEVGMIPFKKPGESLSYHEMGARAARQVLADAGLHYGDLTGGQRAVYEAGMSGINPGQTLICGGGFSLS